MPFSIKSCTYFTGEISSFVSSCSFNISSVIPDTITTNSPEQTSLLGEKIANLIQDNLIICLEGDLGAGKTLFTQSLCKALKVKEIVTSPTFNLMNVYEGKKRIYHFDLYRLEQPEDLEEIGFYEYTDVEDEVVLIEWPDRFFAYMPEDYLHLKIERGDSEQKRIITINLEGQKYKNIYEELKHCGNISD